MTALQLPKGVHVFERGWLSSNNVFFDDGETTWLVDSGYSTHAAQTTDLIVSRLGSRSLDFLVNTHLHSDHCGGNAALQAMYTNLVTVIPPGQSALVRVWDPAGLFYTPTGQRCPRFGFNKTLQIGSALHMGFQKWEIHAAGGHDPHAVLFFEPIERVLISADALWENGFGVVFPELEGIEAFADVAKTLDLIERLDPSIVIPGHGRIFQYSPQVLAQARKKLDGFVSDPIKHARHATKVLLKFKLLEIQKQSFPEFVQWAERTPCIKQYWNSFFSDSEFLPWVEQMCLELVKAGAAMREGEYIVNA